MKQRITEYLRYLKTQRQYSERTLEQYETELGTFYNFLKDQYGENQHDITEIDILLTKEYLFSFSDSHSKKSRSKKLSILRGFFQYYLTQDVIKMNPCKYIDLPKQDKKLPRYVSDSEVSYIFDNLFALDSAFYQRDLLIIAILFGSGLRVSELVDLELQDMLITERRVHVRSGKGAKERFAPLSDIAIQAYQTYMNDLRTMLLLKSHNPQQAVFLNKLGTPLSARGVQYLLQKIGRQLGVRSFSPHMLRHSFASTLLNHGMDLRSVQELLGHESIASTQIYTHIDMQETQKQYDKFHAIDIINTDINKDNENEETKLNI